MTSSVSYSYSLLANKVGTFEIPPASMIVQGRTLKSNSLRISVVKSQAGTNRRSDDKGFFILAEVDTSSTYLGQQLNLTYTLYTRVNLENLEILKSPEKVLRDLCSAIDIRFDKAMLHWPAGPKKEDGCWAKYWYDNVHKSTGFERQSTSSRALPEYLEPLYNESKKYYEQLFEQSIKA